jgi:hypothetical protein
LKIPIRTHIDPKTVKKEKKTALELLQLALRPPDEEPLDGRGWSLL